MINENKIVIRKATHEDGLKVCLLLRLLGLNIPVSEGDMINYWDKLFLKNPIYHFFNEDVAYGWVMEYENEIVGYFGSIPRVYLIDGKMEKVSIASHWGIKKEFRTFSNLLCEKFFCENNCSIKLVTTAIKPTGRIFERYGGFRIPIEKLGDIYLIPLNVFKVIAYKFNNSLINSFINLLSQVSLPWDFRILFLKFNSNIRTVDLELDKVELNDFFSKFHVKTKGLFALRNVEILKWLVQDFEHNSKARYYAFKQDDVIEGLIVFRTENVGTSCELDRYKIIDILTDNDRIKKELIKAVLRDAIENKIDIVEIHHPGMIDKSEISFPLVMKRRSKYFPFFYQTSDNALKDYLSISSNWNITPFDGDTCI